MSNLPSWISVEEHLPNHGDRCAVYEEFTLQDGHRSKSVFEVTKAIYFSDVEQAVSEECYMFCATELEGVTSGFFYITDSDGEAIYDNAYLLVNVKYWMPAEGLCDTTTSDQ